MATTTIFRIWLVPGWQIGDLIKDGDGGDRNSRMALKAILDWHKTINAAAASDHHPGCIACGSHLDAGATAGFALLLPTEPDAVGGWGGYCGAFCVSCYQRGPEAVQVLVERTFARELGGEAMSIH